MNILITLVIIEASLILAFIKYKATRYGYNYENDKTSFKENAPWPWQFNEIWNPFISFLLGGLIGYYFISIRWRAISGGEMLRATDFILMFIFIMCLTGWLPHLLKNITEGVSAILKRVLDGNK
jgi:hypothetical protein